MKIRFLKDIARVMIFFSQFKSKYMIRHTPTSSSIVLDDFLPYDYWLKQLFVVLTYFAFFGRSFSKQETEEY